MKRKIFVVILVLAVVVAVTSLWGYKMFFGAAVEDRFTVVLRDDESYDQMLAKVKSSVAYPMALSIYAKYINLDKGIEAGTYTFTKDMTVIQVARVLKFGSNNCVRLVINNARTPEALASKIAMQIDADSTAIVSVLRNDSIIKDMGFESAEAMFSIFLPNTYEVYSDITPESLVWRLKRESDAFWANETRQAKLKELGYHSHQTATAGLHVHVNRDSLGFTYQEQEETIARILFFMEKNWNELLKFSRRTPSQLERWAARYGYKDNPQEILKTAKGGYGRYTCLNLCNENTIEFRIFRGTLKYNTLIATLQLVSQICSVAFVMSDEDIRNLSWTTFVAGCQYPELIQYLKERRLYINEPVESEVDV
jgi:hypothetical protein